MTVIHLRRDVAIGPLLPEYAVNMYRWMTDPVVSDNLGLRNPPSPERTTEWIEHTRQAADMRAFAVLLDGRHVGNVVIDRIDDHLATGRLSVYVGDPGARAAGVGIAGMYLAMQHCFSDLSLHKIWLTVHARNYRAINTYVKLGFVLEGILRDEFWLQGERLSALYMGLLRSDFDRLIVEWD